MSVSVTLNGLSHTLPSAGETDWGAATTAFLQAVSTSTLQKSGGTFTLTDDAYFGATYGLKSQYFKTATASPSTAGVVRLARADAVAWRNQADGANLLLGPGSDNKLEFNSIDLVDVSTAQTLTNKTLTTPTISVEGWNAISFTNSWIQHADASFSTAGYYKDATGRVYLRGLISTGTLGQAAFTLASGYRPPKALVVAVGTSSASGAGELRILANGQVVPQATCHQTYVSLDNISFLTT